MEESKLLEIEQSIKARLEKHKYSSGYVTRSDEQAMELIEEIKRLRAGLERYANQYEDEEKFWKDDQEDIGEMPSYPKERMLKPGLIAREALSEVKK